jgi:aldose 1-epimerase
MKRILLALPLLFGCAAAEKSAGSAIRAEDVGTHEGRPLRVYTMKAGGLTAKVTNYGTILMELWVPDRSGSTADVVLGFDTPQGYFGGHPFFGCVAGRVANRIANATFDLDGKTYTLAKNNGPHTLHGGKKGWDKYVWTSTHGEGADGPWVRFAHVSPDGDEGYPGTVKAEIVYTLTPKGEFKVEMTATTDQPTLVNLAHHSYWNLAGHGSGDILGHELKLFCERYTPGDATLVPKGTIEPVAGTPYDFRSPKPIGKDIAATGGKPVGYDTNFVVDNASGELVPVAKVVEPKSGRVMELLATEPGVQFYTGNFLDGSVKGKGGAVYSQYAGFCLETQKYPDAIHQREWPSPVLRPGTTYRHVMVHRFSAK